VGGWIAGPPDDLTSAAVELHEVSTVPAKPGYPESRAVEKPGFW